MPLPYRSPLDDEVKRKQAIERLPNWAKTYIARLESDNAHLRQERADMTGDESPIWHMPDYQTKLHLPKRTTVVFRLEQGEIEFELRDGQIKVIENGRGRQSNSRLCILPEITNAFLIGFKES